MPRRRDDGLSDLVFTGAAALPWWGGVLLAAGSYGILRHYAVAAVPAVTSMDNAGQALGVAAGKGMAIASQYLAPLFFLLAALNSVLRRRKRAGLLAATSGNALQGLSWHDFELLVGEAFRRRGYSVSETGGGGADGGTDLRLRRDRELFLVQCKQWRAYKVSVQVVRELYGVMAAEGAAGGFVVTSGVFTSEARAFAEGRNIELIDGPALQAMLEEVRRTRREVPAAAAKVALAPAAPSPESEPSPACPACGHPMVRRVAKKGARAGEEFWGCSRFPDCWGKRSIG